MKGSRTSEIIPLKHVYQTITFHLQFYLQQEESMSLETFLATGWAMMRPVYKMDKRMFTPPSTTIAPPPLQEELTPPPPMFDEEVTIVTISVGVLDAWLLLWSLPCHIFKSGKWNRMNNKLHVCTYVHHLINLLLWPWFTPLWMN